MIELPELVIDFCGALLAVYATKPQGKSKKRMYEPGVGPLQERITVNLAFEHLKDHKSELYGTAKPRRYPNGWHLCDMVIDKEWAIEFRLLRPFGERWEARRTLGGKYFVSVLRE